MAHQKALEELVKRVFKPQTLKKLKYSSKVRERVAFRWQRTIKRLLPLGGASVGNKLQLYNDGADAFEDMWNSIRNAKHKVWMETYIFEQDTIGTKTMKELTDAARRGCEVRLIYDYVGSKNLTSAFLRPIKETDAQVIAFNPLINWPWKIKLWGFFRNHRKVLVVDDKIGYCGGMNVGNEYAGERVGGSGFFRDTHVKVEGPAVADLAKMFITSLQEAGEPLPPSAQNSSVDHNITPLTRKSSDSKEKTKGEDKEANEGEKEEEGVFVQILQSNTFRNRRHIQKAITLTLRHSIHNCYFTTPYFLPPYKLNLALTAAARKKVDIRILTAGVSDVPMLRMASQHIYDKLLRKGVRIYELTGKALHAKTVTIDGIYSSVGSFNLDPWSHHFNLELNLTTVDPEMAQRLEEQFVIDLNLATEVTRKDLQQRNIFQRILHWGAYHSLAVFQWKWF